LLLLSRNSTWTAGVMLVPATVVVGCWRKAILSACGLTVRLVEPWTEALTMSVAVTVWLPSVVRVTVKVPMPVPGFSGAEGGGVAVGDVAGAVVAGGDVVELVQGGHGDGEGDPGLDAGGRGDRVVGGRPGDDADGARGVGERRVHRVGGRDGLGADLVQGGG